MAAHLSSINLIPKNSFEYSNLGKTLKWSLSSGRVLVVFTEFVVLLAFASRFYYDKRVNDIAEEIDQKQALIQSYSEIEAQARAIIAKQKIVDKYIAYNLGLDGKFTAAKRFTPLDTTYDSISIRQGKMDLSGVTGSEMSLMTIVSGLSKMEGVKEISIGSIEYDQRSSLLSFKIAATVGKTP